MTDKKGWDHSPGPWRSHDIDESEEPFGIQWVVDIPDDDGITVSRLYFGDVETNCGRDIGNAYLVAAAPELLDACEAARDHIEERISLGARGWGPTLKQLQAAIERAKGLR